MVNNRKRNTKTRFDNQTKNNNNQKGNERWLTSWLHKQQTWKITTIIETTTQDVCLYLKLLLCFVCSGQSDRHTRVQESTMLMHTARCWAAYSLANQRKKVNQACRETVRSNPENYVVIPSKVVRKYLKSGQEKIKRERSH